MNNCMSTIQITLVVVEIIEYLVLVTLFCVSFDELVRLGSKIGIGIGRYFLR